MIDWENLRQQGTAIVLVSHAMGEVQEFCKRALLLQEGNPLYLGPVQEAVNRYYLLHSTAGSNALPTPSVTAIKTDANQGIGGLLQQTMLCRSLFWRRKPVKFRTGTPPLPELPCVAMTVVPAGCLPKEICWFAPTLLTWSIREKCR